VIPLAKAGNILRLLCRNSASAPCLLPAKYWELMMIRPTLCIAALALACLPVQSQQVNSEAGAMIEARRGLMSQLDSIQTMIDERLTEPEYSYELYDLAHAAASSLDAFALLFPPETRPLDGAAIDGIETTAAAQIWDDLPAFRKLVRDTADNSRRASEATTVEAFQAEWDKVAKTCTSCHETYVSFDPFAGLN
jgi:cytochrome c556